MAKKVSPEKKKYIALAGLGGLLAVVVIYQLFFSAPPPKPGAGGRGNTASTATRSSSTTVTTPEAAEKVAKRQGDKQLEQAEIDALMQDTSPLNLQVIKASGPAVVGSRGNIFDFWIAPPKKPDPPPPPPPITLAGVSPQSATAGTPRKFTLTIYGKNFPADPQIYMNGSPRATKRVNDTTLTTEMTPADYASSGSQSIEVKSQSEPVKLYSNQASFTVSPAPEPPFRFIGVLGEQALIELSNSKDVIRVSKGGSIQNFWRVDAISLQAMEVTHTQFEIKRRVNMQATGR